MITLLHTPAKITPVYSIDGSNLAIVADSNLSSLYSFRYVQQININEIFITQTRIVPSIEGGLGKGVLQANRIFEDFVSHDIYEPGSFNLCENSFINWEIRIGEESDGTLDGSGDSFSIVMGPTATGMSWNGTVQYADEWTYEDFEMTLSEENIRFLTNAPNVQDIGFNESSFLYWINGITFEPPDNPGETGSLFSLKITIYYPNGTNDTLWAIPDTSLSESTIVSIGVGPQDINRLSAENLIRNSAGAVIDYRPIFCGVDYYTVQLTTYPAPIGP